MEIESLAAALEREHHEIDDGIAAYSASPEDPRPLAGRSGHCAATFTWKRSSR